MLIISAVLFTFYLHTAATHVPRQRMFSTRVADDDDDDDDIDRVKPCL
jgi:hypothetical protein